MIRSLAAITALALTLGAAAAQEAAPAAAPAAAPEIVVDPAASLNTSPKQANMLTGFYATQAVIEICSVELDANIVDGMAADRSRLETALGMDAASASEAYDKVKADVEKTEPDCADGSPDRIGVDAVTAIYAALPPPAGATPAPSVDAATTPAPATAPAETPAAPTP